MGLVAALATCIAAAGAPTAATATARDAGTARGAGTATAPGVPIAAAVPGINLRRPSPAPTSASPASGPGPFQQAVDQRRPANDDADIEIRHLAGSVRVFGWEREEVWVTGTLGPDVDRLELEGDADDVEIQVEPRSRRLRGGGERYAAELEVRVPRGASLEIVTAAASVGVEQHQGELSIETISGAVTVTGEPRSVEVVTTNGPVRLQLGAGTSEVDVETVSGDVQLEGAPREVSVETMSGAIHVAGSARECDLSSVAGAIVLDADFSGDGSYDIENFNGAVDISVAEDASVRFEISTYSGPIENDFGQEPRRTGMYTPQRELEFGIGGGRTTVSIETFSGVVRIRRR